MDEPKYKNFIAEVELVTTNSEWEVHFSLQNNKKDDQAY